MRATILTNYFPPDGGSGARLVGEFAQYLARSGDVVEVWCPQPSYHVHHDPQPAGVTVRRSGPPLPAGLPHSLRRGIEHVIRPLLLAGSRGLRPDVLYVWLPPPALLPVAAMVRARFDCRVVCHVQDLFPHNVQDTGVLSWKPAVEALERLLRPFYGVADQIVVHAPSAQAYFANLGLPCSCLPNWQVVPDMPPAQRGGGDGPFHVVYAGVLGLAQGVQAFLDAAAILAQNPAIRFTVAGDGVWRSRVEEQIVRRGLTNVTLFPMLLPDAYRRLVSDANLFVVSLKGSVRYPVIPSKIGDAMALGRPICASLPEGDAADLIRSSGAGIVVPPDSGEALARGIALLACDPGACRAMGKVGHGYALAHLNDRVVLPQLRQLLLPPR